jgi:hypothetical protein
VDFKIKWPAIAGVAIVLAAGAIVAARYSSAPGPSSTASAQDSNAVTLERWSENVDEASKQTDDAPPSGDQQVHDDALQPMLDATDQVEPLAPARLEPFLPESLGGMTRATFSTQRNTAMGMQMTEARATYTSDDGRTWDLQIMDTGTAENLLALAGRAGIEGEDETGSGYDRTYHENGRLVHELWDRGSSRGEYNVVLGDRFTVKIEGQAENIDDLKAALADLDLDALEALKGEGVAKN